MCILGVGNLKNLEVNNEADYRILYNTLFIFLKRLS